MGLEIGKKFWVLVISFLFIIFGVFIYSSSIDRDLSEYELTVSNAGKIARVTGHVGNENLPDPNNTPEEYGLTATDLGIIWDATTNPNEPKVMIAFGDSYDDGWYGFGGGGEEAGWRGNLLAISKDEDLSDGLSISSMVTEKDDEKYAKEIIHSEHDTSGNGDFTAIPTAGISIRGRHYIHYMQIKNWGENGIWNINFSEIAYSVDDGENWIKSGTKWGSDSKFAQAAFIKEGEYVYMFGTPAGRFGNAYLARVKEEDVLEKDKYTYWNGSEWDSTDEASAIPVIDAPVSELSIQYNSHYNKWLMMYLNEDRYSMVVRSSSILEEGWSSEKIIATGEEFPGLYGGYIHPWTNNGKEIYFVMSEWGPYNVALMKAQLDFEEDVPFITRLVR